MRHPGEDLLGVREGFQGKRPRGEGLESEEGKETQAEATAWAKAQKGERGGFKEL